jgi:crotonobetainyl-CoA:carnitine CoA-transferase CaiB-like acyl-CoA transferase
VAQYFLVTGEVPGPVGSAHASAVPYQAFKTKDIHIVIAIFTERFWSQFCNVLGRPDLVEDPRFATNREPAAGENHLMIIAAKGGRAFGGSRVRLFDGSFRP